MTVAVAIVGLIATGLCLLLGIWSAVETRAKRRDVLDAINPPSKPDPAQPPGPVTNQAAVSTAVDSIAKLAAALKDIDRVHSYSLLL